MNEKTFKQFLETMRNELTFEKEIIDKIPKNKENIEYLKGYKDAIDTSIKTIDMSLKLSFKKKWIKYKK